MKPFGPIFKNLREEKGYSLKEVASDIVSIPTLSNFENGHSDIKLTNFVLLLNRIQLTHDEFMIHYSDEGIVEINQLIRDSRLFSGKDMDKSAMYKLKDKYLDLYIKTNNPIYLHGSILFALYSGGPTSLQKSDIEILYNYLKTVETWGKYEIFLFNYTSYIFSRENIIELMPYFLKQAQAYHAFPQVDLHEIYLNQALSFVMIEEMQQAEKIMNVFDTSVDELEVSDLGKRLLGKFVWGLIKLSKGDSSGEKECV